MELDLARRRVQEVSPPHHLVYVLQRVVHHDGELVGGGAVVAPHNEVVYLTLIGPKQTILERYADVLRAHPQGGRTARSFLLGTLSCRQLAAGSGVPVGGEDTVRRRDRGPDLRPRTIAGVEEPLVVESGYRFLVRRQPL